MGEERIELSVKERERLKGLHQEEEGHLKQVEAAQRLGLSARHLRRWQRRVEAEGDRGLMHRRRGMLSNRKIAPLGWDRYDSSTKRSCASGLTYSCLR